jgi:hypothetical protein
MFLKVCQDLGANLGSFSLQLFIFSNITAELQYLRILQKPCEFP